MRLVIIAAIILSALGATQGQSLKSRPSCAFNLPLSPAQCRRLEAGPHAAGKSWTAGSTGTLLYTSQPLLNAIDIWSVTNKGFKMTGQLSVGAGNLPFGLTVDAAQNLYVAISSFGSGTPSVEVFPRGATKPSTIYTTGLKEPIDVAVNAKGTVYVANLYETEGSACGASSGPSGSVVEYDAGSTSPSRTITGFPGCPSGIAADASGNSYLTYVYYPATGTFLQSDVIKYGNKSTTGKALGLKVPGGPQLGGIQVASNGDLVVQNVQDDATVNQILTFPHGSISPSNTIQYPGTGWGTGFKFFALSGNRIFAPAYVAPNFSFVAATPAEFSYPSGRQVIVQSKLGSTGPFSYGFAVSPGK